MDADTEWMKSEIDRLTESAKEREANIANSEEIIGQLKRSAEKVALSKAEQDYVDGLRRDIANIENEKAALREELNRTDELRAQLSNRINELAEKKHAGRDRADEKSIRISNICSRGSGRSIRRATKPQSKWRQEGYDSAEGEQEIARLKRKINSLGSINPNAIEDCKVLKDRYDEMMVQKEDLEQGEADLQQAIDTLKAEMLKTFNEGFNTINEQF